MQTPIVLGLVAWAITWLGSFKVAALVLGTSDLAREPDWHIFAFCFLAPVLATPEAARRGVTWLDKLAQFSATTLVSAVASLGVFTPLLLPIARGEWRAGTTTSLAIHCALLRCAAAATCHAHPAIDPQACFRLQASSCGARWSFSWV